MIGRTSNAPVRERATGDTDTGPGAPRDTHSEQALAPVPRQAEMRSQQQQAGPMSSADSVSSLSALRRTFPTTNSPLTEFTDHGKAFASIGGRGTLLITSCCGP